MYAAGIRNRLFNWCSYYLTGRSQRTVVNGQVSEKEAITCGVPQGSVLGTLFSLVYVYDIQQTLNKKTSTVC